MKMGVYDVLGKKLKADENSVNDRALVSIANSLERIATSLKHIEDIMDIESRRR
jgi:hypothetical protein